MTGFAPLRVGTARDFRLLQPRATQLGPRARPPPIRGARSTAEQGKPHGRRDQGSHSQQQRDNPRRHRQPSEDGPRRARAGPGRPSQEHRLAHQRGSRAHRADRPPKTSGCSGKSSAFGQKTRKKSSCDCWPRTGSRRAARTKNERHAHAQEFALDAGKLRLVAGSYQTHSGILGKYSPLDFYDIHLEPHGKVELDVPGGNKSVMVFTLEGDTVVSGTPVAAKTAAKLGEGDTVTIEAGVTPIEILFMCSERPGRHEHASRAARSTRRDRPGHVHQEGGDV